MLGGAGASAPAGTTIEKISHSFAVTAKSYDDDLRAGLRLNSAGDVSKLETLAQDLRHQLAEAERVLVTNTATLQTRVEVFAPNGDMLAGADGWGVQVGAPRGGGLTVQHVTASAQQLAESWRDEKRKALYQEMKQLYEESLPPTSKQAPFPWESSIERQALSEPVVGPAGYGRGTLEVKFTAHREAHVAPNAALGPTNCQEGTCELIFVPRASFGLKMALRATPYWWCDQAGLLCGLCSCSGKALRFEFGSTDSAEKACNKLKVLCGGLRYEEPPSPSVLDLLQLGVPVAPKRRTAVGSLPIPTVLHPHPNCPSFELKTLDALTDGKAQELVDKFEAMWAAEQPFLSQFVRRSEQTQLGRLEVVPFVGASSSEEDPITLQSKALVDLVGTDDFAEFSEEGGSATLRFHAIVTPSVNNFMTCHMSTGQPALRIIMTTEETSVMIMIMTDDGSHVRMRDGKHPS